MSQAYRTALDRIWHGRSLLHRKWDHRKAADPVSWPVEPFRREDLHRDVYRLPGSGKSPMVWNLHQKFHLRAPTGAPG